MKVLFFVTGVGYGDATREHANIVALLERDPKAKVMVAAYDNSYEYFKDKFRTVKIKGYRIPGSGMEFRVLPFILSNLFLPFSWMFTSFRLRKEIKKFNPDIVVTDFEPSGITAAKMVNKRCVTVFGYNPDTLKEYLKTNKLSRKCWLEAKYFENLYDKADFAVIPNLLGAKKHSILYYYVNPIIRQKPSDLPNKRDLMKKFGMKKEPIIVMLGGSNFGLRLARNLQKVAAKMDEEFLVFGSHKALKESRNFKHIRFTEDFLEYLKTAKAVITLGGQKMLTESLAFRKPILVFPIKDHIEQLMNAYTLRDVAMVGEGISKDELRHQVHKFLGGLPKLQAKMDRLSIEFNGAQQFAKLLEDFKKKPSRHSAKR